MIRNEREYKCAMRKMIRRVQKGEEIDTFSSSDEDMEVLADCIKAGYINGVVTDESGHECRTLDGKIHPVIYNTVIPLKGLAFLSPKVDWKFIIPTVISIIALLASWFGPVSNPPAPHQPINEAPQQQVDFRDN